jgi:hypothetical protein
MLPFLKPYEVQTRSVCYPGDTPNAQISLLNRGNKHQPLPASVM